jgi:hypothetical protein
MPIVSNVIGVPCLRNDENSSSARRYCRRRLARQLASMRRESGQRNRTLGGTLVGMFFFFSNRMGLAGSILVSLLLSVVLLYACSRV